MNPQYVEIFGYAASVFVAISLVMVSLVKLRVLNLIGCIFFVIYGLLLNSVPIILTNGFIVIINIYYLAQMYRKDLSSFSYELTGERYEDLLDFVKVKKKDILRHYPDFSECQLRAASHGRGLIYSAIRGGRHQGFAFAVMGEGLELGSFCEGGSRLITTLNSLKGSGHENAPVFFVDYIVPKYRDLGLASRFHEKLLADIRGSYPEILWLNHRSNRGMRKILESQGYQEFSINQEYELLIFKTA